MNKIEVFLQFDLKATHQLDEREEEHGHIWRINVGVTGPLHEGRVASMPRLREVLAPAVTLLQDSLLNTNPNLDAQTRTFPTCEHLALYFENAFRKKLQEAAIRVRLTEVEVSVDELDGTPTGSARLKLD